MWVAKVMLGEQKWIAKMSLLQTFGKQVQKHKVAFQNNLVLSYKNVRSVVLSQNNGPPSPVSWSPIVTDMDAMQGQH